MAEAKPSESLKIYVCCNKSNHFLHFFPYSLSYQLTLPSPSLALCLYVCCNKSNLQPNTPFQLTIFLLNQSTVEKAHYTFLFYLSLSFTYRLCHTSLCCKSMKNRFKAIDFFFFFCWKKMASINFVVVVNCNWG
jgi:hypothetical protein